MRPPFEEDYPTRALYIPHPMLTLPPEIIAEIFANFLPPYPERPPLAGLYSPLILCRICAYWRQVALSTPTLWRAIQIDLRDWDSDKGRTWRLYLLNTWLRRSGDCSLSIYIHHTRGYIPRPTIPEFYHAIARHRQQLEHLDIVASFGNLSLVQGDMPRLRHLTLGPNDLPDSSKPTPPLFDCAPHLTSVVLTQDLVPSTMPLPWAQFTRLEGICLYEHECAEIFTSATQLVHCTVALVGSPPETDIPMVPPHLHLQTLILRVSDMSRVQVDLPNLFNRFTLPALRTLQVPEPYMSVAALKSLVSRSGCTLRELRVEDVVTSAGIIYRAAFPSIEVIIVDPAVHERVAVRQAVS
ncbi:hypothetical protein C8R46DRAFT_268523 [Mycena filopes]|nr:hypothetical protein C8R46DRAFT_268523 [Mycena filopes]